MTDPNARVIAVEIHGLRYPIRSSLDATYITELASYVDEKMRAASEESSTGDSVKIAVLAALNIADEYFRATSGQIEGGGEESAAAAADALEEVLSRAEALERLVDQVLDPDLS